MSSVRITAVVTLLAFAFTPSARGEADPRSEPPVPAVGKVLPAVMNINTERVVRQGFHDRSRTGRPGELNASGGRKAMRARVASRERLQ